MRWQGRRESENVEDRRDEGGAYDDGGGGFGVPFPGGGGGGGGFQIPMGQGGGMGILGLVIVAGIALLLGVDPRVILSGGGEEMPGGRHIQLPSDPGERNGGAEDGSMKKCVSVVLADTEDTWSRIFAEKGQRYTPPKLVLFRTAFSRAAEWRAYRPGLFTAPTTARFMWISPSTSC